MPIEVKIPSVGESVTRGTLGAWRKKNGDFVRDGEVLFEVETEKVTSEVYATASGILTQLVPDGADVQIGQVVGRIEEQEGVRPQSGSDSAEVAASESQSIEIDLSPVVRRIIEEKGLSPEEIKGSGKEGRILKEDILKYLESRPATVTTPMTISPTGELPPTPSLSPSTPAPILAPTPMLAPIPQPQPEIKTAPSSHRETRKKMSQLRQKIADRLVAAQQTSAILTTFNEADMSNILAIRSKFQERFQTKYNIRLGFMSFFVKAVVRALQTIPVFNARIEGDEIIENHYYDIGVALSTEKGLMVPVIRDADKLSFASIEKEIQNLSQKGRTGKITLAELQGGVFTISNGGIYGSLLSTPILNPPQSGILGMHAIQERPVAIQGRVEIRPMMYLALSYDHRIVDGKEAVSFLIAIKEFIEQPSLALLEI